MHNLIKFSLFQAVKFLHHIELVSESPEVVGEIKPPFQGKVSLIVRMDAQTFLSGKIYNLLSDWIHSLGELRRWMIHYKVFTHD
jgi:hypothetical protein